MFDALIEQSRIGVPAEPIPPYRRSVMLQQILAYLRQVPKNRRVAEQFQKVLSSSSRPVVTEDFVSSLLEDLSQQGFLDCKANVYQPASEGWGFIESNRVYGNIQSNPVEVSLIDVDTGNAVGSVASLSSQDGRVRVAGKSYEVLPSRLSNQIRIRATAETGEVPKYHARKLPYSFSIGVALANRFGIAEGTIIATKNADVVIIMTWLGRLLNRVLGEKLRARGYRVSDGAFHIAIEQSASIDPLAVLKQAADDAIKGNPLSVMKPEEWVDMGPHFRLLSEKEKQHARADWLDADFLRNHFDQLQSVQWVVADSPIMPDLLSLL